MLGIEEDVGDETFYPAGCQRPMIYHLKERNVLHLRIKDLGELKQFYKIGGKIGQGRFGTVVSVRDKQTGKEWAMKTIIKSMSGDRLLMAQREINILKHVEHPHIIYLDKLYETTSKIYLVLEKCCGELAKIYQKEKPFAESKAKKMFSELVEAVVYLHKYDIVHRDLKLENILTSENPLDPSDKYYIKLSDFGLSVAKFSAIDSVLHDYCGTITYMAPEIITNRSYTQQCDTWALGIILYMMVVGQYPFYSKDEKELLQLICKGSPVMDENKLSVEIIDLIERLLAKDSARRLTASEILEHPWINNRGIGTKRSLNILEMMKEWKPDMMVSERNDSSEADVRKDPRLSKKSGALHRQALELPKTDIKFDRRKGNKRNGEESETIPPLNRKSFSDPTRSARSSISGVSTTKRVLGTENRENPGRMQKT